MNIIVNEELKAYIDPLTPDEYAALERSILMEGCRDALILWGEVLVDGHNRYGICQKHGIPFNTVQNTRFQSMEDVHLWMIVQHLGRRSVSDFQRGVLALRKREIEAERHARAKARREPAPDATVSTDMPTAMNDGVSSMPSNADIPQAQPLQSREDIARAARIKPTQVGMIEKIQKQAAPEVVAAVKAGDISINAAAVVATLPVEEQKAAAQAGKDELKQVVKRVREARRKPKDQSDAEHSGGGHTTESALSDSHAAELTALRQRVGELEAENAALRQEVQMLSAQLVG